MGILTVVTTQRGESLRPWNVGGEPTMGRDNGRISQKWGHPLSFPQDQMLGNRWSPEPQQEFPLDHMTLPRVGFMVRGCLSLSYAFQPGYFLLCLMCRNYTASVWIPLKENFSGCSCRFDVSMGGDNFRFLCCHHGTISHIAWKSQEDHLLYSRKTC